MLKTLLALVATLYAAVAFAAVDVNKATAADLDGIKGIGPAMSTKIMDARKKGEFKDWQDFVDRVKGIGEGNAAKLSDAGLTVNGTSFKPMAKMDAPKAAKKDADKAKMDTAKAAETPPKK